MRATGTLYRVLTLPIGPHVLFLVDEDSPLLSKLGTSAAAAAERRDCADELYWVVD
jgi:hypothetical protein